MEGGGRNTEVCETDDLFFALTSIDSVKNGTFKLFFPVFYIRRKPAFSGCSQRQFLSIPFSPHY